MIDVVGSAAEKTIIEALADHGVRIDTLDDLVNKPTDARAIPILLSFLNTDIEDRVKEVLVRGLTVREAKGKANQTLIREFRRPDIARSYRWVLGNALGLLLSEEDFSMMSDLLLDKSYGTGRQMIVYKLWKIEDPRAVDVLMALLEDEDVRGHAISALGRIGTPKARSAIEKYVTHPNGWIRKTAKNALKQIDRKCRKVN
jgi:HEAT repeat protein